MKLIFTREAATDYGDAAAYYESKQPGLGDRFVEDAEALLEALQAFPRLGAAVVGVPEHLDVRRVVVQRFGVEVNCMLGDDSIRVVAIFHGSREPGFWHRRTGRRRPTRCDHRSRPGSRPTAAVDDG